jgi:hypothetical protein
MVTYGDEVAEAIEPGCTEEALQTEIQEAQRLMEERCSRLEDKTASEVDSELQDLERQLDMLHSAGLAEELRGRTKDMFGTPGFGNAGGSTAEWSDHAAAGPWS